MKAYLRGLLKQWVERLVDYLLDVVLDDKVAWLETQIQRVPDLKTRMLDKDNQDGD